MFKGDYKWQHDYVRLALDTGFCFELHKSDTSDKNIISSTDVERIIEERDFATIERLLPSLIKFVLDQEQAQILDTAFVKTFRLNQLALQYLLYCKKYLDNSLIIIKEEVAKLKTENKELNLFVDDLKEHVSQLMKEIEDKHAFQCGQCNKVFSSEDFLSSHIKRRHSIPIIEVETDKLQMEIKELKGRLNSAEKKLQKEQEVDCKETEFRKVEELHQKFDDLKDYVHSELKMLQTQQSFMERYQKLFEISSQSKSEQRIFGRREMTTQTDNDFRQPSESLKTLNSNANKENIEYNNAQKVAEIGDSLENKVTSSLQKIENQMQSFWSKLNELERSKDYQFVDYNKPKPKMRTKHTMQILEIPDDEESKIDDSVEEKIKDYNKSSARKTGAVNEQSMVAPKKITVIDIDNEKKENLKNVKKEEKEEHVFHMMDLANESDTSSETNTPEKKVVAQKVQIASKPLPVPRKLPSSRFSKSYTEKTINKNPVIDKELIKKFKSEIEKVVVERLQELGVSADWNGLPNKSYQRAMEIVTHQNQLIKKNYSNYDYILSSIDKKVSEKIGGTKLNVEAVKPKKRKIKPKPKLEIKNRKLYDTDDSESEAKNKIDNVPYSAVIQELKIVTSKKEDHSKGVLKSYPSAGSLTKKKVLFNLDTEARNFKDGSSTSIASSVFDPTPRNEKNKKEKDVEDLSDFDFSEM